MPTKYEYDPYLNIINVFPYGELSPLDIVAYFEEIINDDQIKNGCIEVVHFHNIDNFLFSSNEASEIADLYVEVKERKNVVATILIGKTDLQFGLARMMELLLEMGIEEHAIYTVRSDEEADKVIKKMKD